MRCLALASYDSFLNVASLIAPYFGKHDTTVDYAVVRARKGPQISSTQLSAITDGKAVRWLDIEDFCTSGEIGRYDIVLSCLEGYSTRRLLHYVEALPDRPLVISAYPGLVLRFAFDGYSMRSGSDLVWLNSQQDLSAYTDMCEGFSISADNARVLGAPSLLAPRRRRFDAENGPVVFFEQAIIPRHRDERLYLCEQLLALAARFPDRQFKVKPRTSKGEATLHRTQHPIAPLFDQAAARMGGMPKNFSLSREPTSDLLQQASHCLTVSSTVAVEAIHLGVPTAIIGDFGAHEENGLHYFFKSGLIRNFADIDFPFAGMPKPEWLQRYVSDPNESIEKLAEEAVALARGKRKLLSASSKVAEMSEELRDWLFKLNGIDSTLARQHHKSHSHIKKFEIRIKNYLKKMKV